MVIEYGKLFIPDTKDFNETVCKKNKQKDYNF